MNACVEMKYTLSNMCIGSFCLTREKRGKRTQQREREERNGLTPKVLGLSFFRYLAALCIKNTIFTCLVIIRILHVRDC